MSERNVTVIVGDWSNAGHGRTNTCIYKIEGDDVSDETIKKNFADSCEKIGFNFMNFCRESENYTMPDYAFDTMIEHGLKTETVPSNDFDVADDKYIYFDSEVEDKGEVPLSNILSLYLKMKVTPISKPQILIGGDKGLLINDDETSSFGYGLF